MHFGLYERENIGRAAFNDTRWEKKKEKKGVGKKKKVRSTETVDEFLHFQTALACVLNRVLPC